MGLRFPTTSFISTTKKSLRFESFIHNKSQAGFHKLPSLVKKNRVAAVVPKGHVAVYVGDIDKKRIVIPISYLSHPLFQDLLSSVEEDYGFSHPMGGLTIPCNEDVFLDLKSQVDQSC